MPTGIDNRSDERTEKGKQMSYFQGNIGSTPGMGFTEEINDALMRNFHDYPYAGTGLITASNLEWLREQEFPFISFGNSGSTHAQLVTPIKPGDSELFGLLIEVLNGLSDYPLVDDEIYSRMEAKIVGEFLTELAETHSIDPELLVEFHNEGMSNSVEVESDFNPYLAGEDDFISDFKDWETAKLARLHGAVTLDI